MIKKIEIKKLLEEFEVNDEEELEKKLNNDYLQLPCIICKKEYLFDTLIFLDGDPYCKHCIKYRRQK